MLAIWTCKTVRNGLRISSRSGNLTVKRLMEGTAQWSLLAQHNRVGESDMTYCQCHVGWCALILVHPPNEDTGYLCDDRESLTGIAHKATKKEGLVCSRLKFPVGRKNWASAGPAGA